MTIVSYSNTTKSFDELAHELNIDEVTGLYLKEVEITGDDADMLFAKCLRGHPSLEEFTMIGVTLKDPNASLEIAMSMLLVSTPRLSSVHMENTHISQSALQAIVYCSAKLTKLLLPNNGLTDKDADSIAKYASSHGNSIEEMDLSGNDISDLGGAALNKALEKNVSLRALKLDNNRISGETLGVLTTDVKKRAAMAA
jgi:Ran GTPase-activating protein (RanGAP) involved in mRNA processing and transport